MVEVLLYVHKNHGPVYIGRCRNRRFIRDGSPGRPPRLSQLLSSDLNNYNIIIRAANQRLEHRLFCLEYVTGVVKLDSNCYDSNSWWDPSGITANSTGRCGLRHTFESARKRCSECGVTAGPNAGLLRPRWSVPRYYSKCSVLSLVCRLGDASGTGLSWLIRNPANAAGGACTTGELGHLSSQCCVYHCHSGTKPSLELKYKNQVSTSIELFFCLRLVWGVCVCVCVCVCVWERECVCECVLFCFVCLFLFRSLLNWTKLISRFGGL